eukprot:Em0008g1131a
MVVDAITNNADFVEADDSSSRPAFIADLSIRGVWQPQTVALLDVRVIDTDAHSYASHTVDAVLCSAEQEKKRKYSAAVEERRASFTPFVVSVDGVLGHDAQHLMKRLCDQIAMKAPEEDEYSGAAAEDKVELSLKTTTDV